MRSEILTAMRTLLFWVLTQSRPIGRSQGDWTTGRSRFDPRLKQKDFTSSLSVQTGSEAHPASCTMGTGGPFPGAKARPVRDADHSPPSSAEVESE
jgi:hypothetical protein